MRNINDNTVSSENQLPRDAWIFYMGSANASKRLLIIGNSITRHGPNTGIGWDADWGMAASDIDHDYVHLLQSRLTADGKDVLTMVRSASLWERNHAEENHLDDYLKEHEFAADVILFRIGENVLKTADMEVFAARLREFLTYINPKKAPIVFTSTVWDSQPRNAVIRELAEEWGMPFIDLTEIGRRDDLMAIGLFEHKGVAMHPGDAGMRYIADAVYPEIKSRL
jgi:hypothetical protein